VDAGRAEAETSWDWPALERLARREVRRVLRDVRDVDDAVQEALVRAWRHRAKLSGERAPEPWVARIARNEALRAAGHASARAAREVELTEAREPAAAGGVPEAEHFDVRRALRPLAPQDRTLIGLRYFADLSHPELADALDLPIGTVKVRLHRLRARLAERLEERP
jgi:RNA polymerase sigma-70 factor (ECF subfamily)